MALEARGSAPPSLVKCCARRQRMCRPARLATSALQSSRVLPSRALAPAVLVVNGENRAEVPQSARDVLKALPRGAYTVARTWQRTRLVDWTCGRTLTCPYTR